MRNTIRWFMSIIVISVAILMVGSYLAQLNPESSAAVPAPPPLQERSLARQATTIEEVEARGVPPLVEPMAVFEDEQFGYQISYPLGWEKITVTANEVLFKSLDGLTQITVEAVGPLATDSLSTFVERNLDKTMVNSRILLTINGFSAERVLTGFDQPENQITTFYIETETATYIISGAGEQQPIEMTARSFKAALGI